MGCIVACLKQEGTHPEDKEELIIVDTVRPIFGKTFRNSGGDITSRGQENSLIFLSKSIRSGKDRLERVQNRRR